MILGLCRCWRSGHGDQEATQESKLHEGERVGEWCWKEEQSDWGKEGREVVDSLECEQEWSRRRGQFEKVLWESGKEVMRGELRGADQDRGGQTKNGQSKGGDQDRGVIDCLHLYLCCLNMLGFHLWVRWECVCPCALNVCVCKRVHVYVPVH